MLTNDRALSIETILPSLSCETEVCKIVKYREFMNGMVNPLIAEYNIIREKNPYGTKENNAYTTPWVNIAKVIIGILCFHFFLTDVIIPPNNIPMLKDVDIKA
jgi:hypothetical protein